MMVKLYFWLDVLFDILKKFIFDRDPSAIALYAPKLETPSMISAFSHIRLARFIFTSKDGL